MVITTAAAIVVGGVVAIATAGTGVPAMIASGMAAGAAGGFTGGAVGTALAGGNFGDAMNAGLQGAAIGSISGAFGAAAGGLAATAVGNAIGSSFGGFWAGALQGVAGGAAGGFTGGSIGAWLNGASFGDGLLVGLKGAGMGAAIGGLIGGISNGIKAKSSKNYSIIDLRELQGGSNPTLSENQLEQFTANEFNIIEGNKNISDITVRPPSGSFTFKGVFYNKEVGAFAGATDPSFWTGKVSVHIAPVVTQNPIYLKGVLIHELTHAHHYYLGLNNNYSTGKFRNSSEYTAINAQLDYYKSFNSNNPFITSLIQGCNNYLLRFTNPTPIQFPYPYVGRVVFVK